MRIASKNDLRAFARSGNDGFDFVRGEVLRFVDDEVLVGQTSAANVGNGFDLQNSTFEKLHESTTVTIFAARRIREQKFEIVENGLHPRIELFVDVARQISNVATKGNDGPAHEKSRIHAIVDGAPKSRSERQKSFTGTSFAHERDESNGFVEEQIEGVRLFLVAWSDAHDSIARDTQCNDLFALGIITTKRGMRGICSVAEKNARIGAEFVVVRKRDKPLLEEGIDEVCRDVHIDNRGLLFRIGRALAFVRFAGDSERVSTNAEVGVHCYEDSGFGLVFVADIDGCLEDGEVLGARFEADEEVGSLFGDGDAESAAVFEGDAGAEGARGAAEAVEQASDGAGAPSTLGAFAFEFVDLFNGVDRNNEVVVLEFEDGVGIVKKDVGVENVVFPHEFWRR